MAKNKSNISKLKFEDAIEQLEELIELIESGEVGLEQSLEQYEHGMSLLKHCRGVLGAAEKKIATLSTEAGDKLVIDDDADA